VHVRAAEEEISVLGGFFRGKYYSSAQKLEEAINSAIKGRVAELCEAIQNLSSERRP
jgi:hypothetical protein